MFSTIYFKDHKDYLGVDFSSLLVNSGADPGFEFPLDQIV